MLSLQAELFCLMGIGYILARKDILTAPVRAKMTTIVLTIILPAAIIRSFEIDLTSKEIQGALTVFVIAVFIQVLYSIFSHLLWKKESVGQRINLRYGTLVSNAGFMGMPVAQGVFGDIGLLYASIFLIPQRIVMWSAGLSLYTNAQTKRQVLKKVLTHPCIIGIMIGLAVMVLRHFHISLPGFLDATIAACAASNTALSMIIIGGMLADADKKSVFTKTTVLYSCIRLLVLPAIIWAVLAFIPVSSVASGVCVLLSAMPAASTTAMLAQQYDKDPEFASKLIFVSTLFSLVTLPVWTFILL